MPHDPDLDHHNDEAGLIFRDAQENVGDQVDQEVHDKIVQIKAAKGDAPAVPHSPKMGRLFSVPAEEHLVRNVYQDEATLCKTKPPGERKAVDGYGPPQCTSPHTDAPVFITLVGSASGQGQPPPESGRRQLTRSGDEHAFLPGHMDEFSVVCQELGDLTKVVVELGSGGQDWSSMRWKLDKIVVSCLRSDRGQRPTPAPRKSLFSCCSAPAPMREGRPPQGDHAVETAKTTQTPQWHFVKDAPLWLGAPPQETAGLEDQIEAALQIEQELQAELRHVHDELTRDMRELGLRREANRWDDPHEGSTNRRLEMEISGVQSTSAVSQSVPTGRRSRRRSPSPRRGGRQPRGLFIEDRQQPEPEPEPEPEPKPEPWLKTGTGMNRNRREPDLREPA